LNKSEIAQQMITDKEELAGAIKQYARELGFDMCGIAPASPSAFRRRFLDWLEADYAGEMEYMRRDPERRLDPCQILPAAKSIIVTATNYYSEQQAPSNRHDAIFARYALNEDYHDVLGGRLRNLLNFITEQSADPVEGKIYVDTGPLLERELAQRAGIGWFGKNAMIINSHHGSWFLLGEIILTLPLPADNPAIGGCGSCTRCVEACPTGAIVGPYVVDARKCISYQTIEQKGRIPDEITSRMGNRIFGCDICQDVCPFNIKRAQPTEDPAFLPRTSTKGRTLEEIARLSEEEFRREYKGSPVKRAKRRGLVRNAVAALSSAGDDISASVISNALDDPDPLIRDQAALDRYVHSRYNSS
jgi:epoxyqueuosine reductase